MERKRLLKMSMKKIAGNSGAQINPNLCFYTPKEVFQAISTNETVKRWLHYISELYEPPKKNLYLFFPCSTVKPYHESRSYRMLFKTLNDLGALRDKIHIFTISEPFGLVPEEFYGKETEWHDWKRDWYDAPGLFQWWVKRMGLPYEEEYVDRSIELLARYVAKFLTRAVSINPDVKLVGFVRTYTSKLTRKKDHTHRRILERASELAGVRVEILPKKELVRRIVMERGKVAWDMYGVAHPLALKCLQEVLKNLLGADRYDG